MSRERGWPSRKFQVAVIVLLLIGTAVCFRPPVTREGIAKRAYENAWFSIPVSPIPSYEPIYDPHSDSEVEKLEKALRLSPGNSLYEQSLVWFYPKGRLPKLLKDRKLGPEARRLAAWMIYRLHLVEPTGAYKPDEKVEAAYTKVLDQLEILRKADPDNPLVRYQKAHYRSEMGRMPEAIAEIQAGNRLGEVRFYYPDVSEKVMCTRAWLDASTQVEFREFPNMRRLAMALREYGNERLREGDVAQACAALETGRDMGLKLMTAHTTFIISPIVGGAGVFQMSARQLEPIYKDMGMKDRLDRLKAQRAAVEKALSIEKEWTKAREKNRSTLDVAMKVQNFGLTYVSIPKRYFVPVTLAISVFSASALLVLSALLWVSAAIVRRVRGGDVMNASPWREGFLSKLFLVAYLVAFAALLGVMRELMHPWSTGVLSNVVNWIAALLKGGLEGQEDAILFSNAVYWIMPAADIVICAFLIRKLHRSYDHHIGERRGLFGFMFMTPSSVKEWTGKYLAAAFAAQILFSLCCFCAVTIIYFPKNGGNPLEFSRYPYRVLAQRKAVQRMAAEIRNVGLGSTGAGEGKLIRK